MDDSETIKIDPKDLEREEGSDSETRKTHCNDLKSEEASGDLLQSAKMRPYRHVAEATLAGKGLKKAVAEVAELPLEDRYTWRILSALKWAFADFDTISVTVDRRTLKPDDRQKIIELIKHRPIDFCLFLRALFGSEAMGKVMLNAIEAAKRVGEPTLRDEAP